jgi:hypothetical protein
MKPQPLQGFDKLYWLRIGLAAIAGLAANLLVGTDYASGVSLGIGVYLVSYYAARFTWYRSLDKQAQGKVYTTGIGTFVIMFLFTWMFFFTLRVSGYPV